MQNVWAFACISLLLVAASLGMAVFGRQIQPRSESYGFDKILETETGNWDFPGTSLKPVRPSLGYHFERGGASARVLFVGDSHVQQYYPRIDRLLSEYPETTKSVAFVTQVSFNA